MPAALAFSAMRLPTAAAAAVLPPLPLMNSARTPFSAVEAEARILAPSSEMTLA